MLEVIVLCLGLPAFSQVVQLRDSGLASPSLPFQENSEARTVLQELFYATEAALEGVGEKVVLQRSTGSPVKFRIERQGGHLYYLFLNQRASGFPIAGQGNYVVKRDPQTGQFVQIKVFIRDHAGCFLRLFPAAGRSSMDVYLFGVPVDKNVLVPVEFQSLLTAPFSRLLKLTQATVRWHYLLYGGEPQADRLSLAQVQAIRQSISRLGDRDDGALDAGGRYVFIESGLPQAGSGGLNCAGFAKWVVDGFYYPLAGRYLEVAPLKDKHFEYRGNRWSLRYEEQRDPYFGLDWSRNLATSLWQAWGYPAAGPEYFDVRRLEYLRYSEDVGFRVEELELALFLEAAANPGHFYLGSLNRQYGGQPVLRQHFHLAVLFPFFLPDGSLRVVVFDRNRESSLSETVERFSGNFIHLVRLPLGPSFNPPLAAPPD